MNQRTKHHDKKNALSIIIAAEQEMHFTLKQPVTEESAFNIIRNIYECFRMLGDAKLISKGIVSQDHIEQIKELEAMHVNTDRPIRLIDSLRKLRHNINYYGYKPKIPEVADYVDFAKKVFYKTFDEVKRIVGE